MAEIAKSGIPSLSTVLPCDANKLPALGVGEDIEPGDACRINTADGKLYKSDGTGAAGPAAEVDGFSLDRAKVGQRQSAVLVHDVNLPYATGLTPGTFLYLSPTVRGGLATAPGAAQAKPIARVITATRIRALRTY